MGIVERRLGRGDGTPTRPLTNSADDKALLEKKDKSPDSPPVEKPVPAPAPQPVKKSKIQGEGCKYQPDGWLAHEQQTERSSAASGAVGR